MRVLINHLTRMHGGHICVAGVDLDTRRHVRPVLDQENMPFYLLARYGGPFDIGRIVDLGAPRPTPDGPHVEDWVFVPSRVKVERTVSAHEFWNVLYELHETRLCEIFGEALQAVGRGRFGTAQGQGRASLGCLRPAGRPRLYLAPGRDGKPQIRMELSDGQIEADAGVTDLRLCHDDHATPDEDRVRGVAKWIMDCQDVILGLGLTRPFRPSEDQPYRHWLQVNNVHLKEDPLWQLG